MIATLQPETKSPSRRALLARALRGLGPWAASAMGRPHRRPVALLFASVAILSACSASPSSAAPSATPSLSSTTPSPSASIPPSAAPSPTAEIIAFKTGTANVTVTIGTSKGSMTAPLVEVTRPDQNTAGGYFFGYRNVRPDGIRDYLELSLPDLTSATYVNKGGTKYVNIGVQNITWTSPGGTSSGWSTQGLDSCSVVIARTPTGGIAGTIDCTGEAPMGAAKVPYHAQGTFTAEP